jgi:hypothetical protein
MKKIFAALTLMLALGATARPASAYFLNCAQYRAAILSGDEPLMMSVVSHSLGVSDMLATMLCFVGDRRCSCIQSVSDRAEAFGNALGNRIASCPASAPAVGQEFNAALDVCR